MANKKTLLFYRSYHEFRGGHLKVFDYFRHAQSSDTCTPQIYVESTGSQPHPWTGLQGIVRSYVPERADCLFLAGLDWEMLHDHPGIEERIPVINLIQGLRHADPNDRRFSFLGRKAIRICVSEQVKDALVETGQCNGPIHVISNGIDTSQMSHTKPASIANVLISGLKQPKLAVELHTRLLRRGLAVDISTEPLPRPEYLAKIADSSIVVTLPNPSEGFFLPALEAMAMGKIVICPNCIGNRSFCLDEVTCLMPAMQVDELEASVLRIYRDQDLADKLRESGKSMSMNYTMAKERHSFHAILNTL